jgi:hypothetical protein
VTPPFEPVLDRPRWSYALDLLRQHEVGETVSYEDLASAIQSDKRSVIQSAVRQAGQRLLTEDMRAIEAVPNRGYRIVQPEEHLRLSRSQGRRSQSALTKGRDVASYTDLNGMDPAMRAVVLATAQGFNRMHDMLRSTNRQLASLGRAQAALEKRVNEASVSNDDRLARLEAQIAELQQGSD